jgi:hypothetical protein
MALRCCDFDADAGVKAAMVMVTQCGRWICTLAEKKVYSAVVGSGIPYIFKYISCGENNLKALQNSRRHLHGKGYARDS